MSNQIQIKYHNTSGTPTPTLTHGELAIDSHAGRLWYSDNSLTEKYISLTDLESLSSTNLTAMGNLSGTNTGDQTLPTRGSLNIDTDDNVQFNGIGINTTGAADKIVLVDAELKLMNTSSAGGEGDYAALNANAVGSSGGLTISTVDSSNAGDSNVAHIELAADGDITLDANGQIKLEPIAGNNILLDGTIAIDAGVVTGATSITSTEFVGGGSGLTFNTGISVKNAAISGGIIKMYEDTDNGSNYQTIRANSSLANDLVLFQLPPDNGTNQYVLQTDGNGITSWVQFGLGMTGAIAASNAAVIPGVVPAGSQGVETNVLSSAGTWVNQPSMSMAAGSAVLTFTRPGLADTTFTFDGAANQGISVTRDSGSAASWALDIDGMNDIGAALASGDLFAVDDGANGTNKKTTIDRISTYVQADIVDSAPSALDTLNELAAALGDDASFSTTMTNALAAKSPIASPTFTGTVAIPNVANLETAVVANTAKVTNATHTGDVTGSTALTIASGAVDIAMLSATGTASSSTFLRGDNTWVTPTDTNTTYTGGTNLTLSGTTFNVDDAFLKNDANDTTSGTITAGGFTTTGSITLAGHAVADIDVTSEASEADDHLMTSLAIKNFIEDYGYTTNAGDITGVDLTGGTGITIGSETNTTSGAYSSTITNSGVTSIVAGSNISISGATGAVTVTATDNNTTYTGGTNLTLSGTTFNVDDAFLKNDANDTTSGTITAGGFTTTGTWTFDEYSSGTVGITTVQDSGTTFNDNDTSLMTAAAINDRIGAISGGGEANQNAWTTITVPSGTTSQVADSTTDTVAFTAAGGMTITGGADDTIQFSSSDTNTTYTGGTNLTLSGTTFNVDDAFLKNDANDTTSGTITAGGFTTTGSITLAGHAVADIDITSEASEADDHLMTSLAIKNFIEDYGYTTDANVTHRTITAGSNTLANSETLAFTAGSNVTITESAGAVTIASTDTNTTYSVGDGGLTQNNFTNTLKSKLDAIEASATADQTKADINALDITELGTVDSGVWQGTAIAGGYIANDAIDSQHYAADSIDTEHYAANSVDADALNVSGDGTSGYSLTSDGDGSFSWTNISSGGSGDMTGVDLTGGTGITIGSETGTTSGDYSATITNSGVTSIVAGSNISISGATGAVTVTGTDTNTTYTGGTNLTLSGTTFNVDDAFLKNDANDTTSGTITAGGFTTTGSITLSAGAHSFNDIDIGSEFTDADDHIMSSGAIKEKIEDYGYTTNTGDITGVTAGTGLSGGGSSGGVTLSHTSHTGEVTGSTALTVADNVIDEANLKVSNSPTNGYALTAQSGNTGGLTWAEVSGGGVPTQITVADESSDTTCFPVFGVSATGDIEPKTGSNLTFNSATGTLEATGLRGTIGTATQGTIDHDSLANFVSNEHIDWTASSAGTIHSSNYTNTTYSEATGSAEGLMSVAHHDKLDGIAANATANTGDITGVTAGTGMSGGGSSGSVTLTNAGVTSIVAGSNISISGATGAVTVTGTDTNTTYSAGTGLDLSSTTFSVDVSDFMTNGANNYLVTATGADGMNAEVGLRSTGSNLFLKNESSAAADILNYGQLWVKDNGSGADNTDLYFTNDAGTDIQITDGGSLAGGGGGGAGVAISGSPADDMIGVWTSGTGMEGTGDLTFASRKLTVGSSGNSADISVYEGSNERQGADGTIAVPALMAANLMSGDVMVLGTTDIKVYSGIVYDIP